jgi:hypothetical protein
METEGLLSCSEDYPAPDWSILHPNIFLLRSILILSSHRCLGLPSYAFYSGFRLKLLKTWSEDATWKTKELYTR